MFSLVFRTFTHFYKQLVPVVLGVAVAGAVIVGALIVGDSVRGSLRHMAMDRIGNIDQVLLAPRWFSPDLLHRNDTSPTTHEVVFLPQATANNEVRDEELRTLHRANEMTLLGVDSSFWKLGTIAPQKLPQGEEVVLNRTLAEALHVEVGDTITLRVSANALVPAESALGKRDQDSFVLPRWKVVDILPDESLARFSLRSDQRPPMNAFVDKKALQQAIEIGQKINAIFAEAPGLQDQTVPLLSLLAPSSQDLGIKLETVSIPSAPSEQPIVHYDHITTDQMLLGDAVATALLNETARFKPTKVLTYLANGVEKKTETNESQDERSNVPYSTISATDWSLVRSLLIQSDVKPTDLAESQSRKDWVVVNQWLADELQLQVGDRLAIDYFLPETVEGIEVEKQFEGTVVAIAPLTEPATPYRRNRDATFASPPTRFNDPNWTPTVPGITDQDSISKWDTPFPLKRTITPRDDAYWNNYRLTPKLFISYELGQELFGSRFGELTSIRYDGVSESERAELQEIVDGAVRNEMESLGWREVTLREDQLARSGGTTPFDGLFLALSGFLILSALLLVALLFQLSMERRANHWGLMAATGWARPKIRRFLLMEGALLSSIGATAGIALGALYAYGMIALLRTWWVGAITVSFLDFYLRPTSALIGWLLSFLAAMLAIYVASRRIDRSSIAALLKGRIERNVTTNNAKKQSSLGRRSFPERGPGVSPGVAKVSPGETPGPRVSPKILSLLCMLMGVGILAGGGFLQGQAQAGAFVGAGMLFLMAGLFWAWERLRTVKSPENRIPDDLELARSNTKRSPTRSILAMALVAVASFLILSMSLFQASPTELGTGGFTWMGKSSSPIYIELGNADARREGLGIAGDPWRATEIVSIRLRGGDDASCNNLYQANEPQILGISPRIEQIDRDSNGRSRFAWFQTSREESPWRALAERGDGTKESPIPVVLDQNTALWALHLGGYVGEVFSFEFDGVPLHFRTVCVLQNTILQGALIIGESNFVGAFPSITGYRSYLVRVPEERKREASELQMLLENGWEEQGLSLVTTESVLSQLLAVQNTYLSAFQLLGALGLMLGTIGLGVTQLRSALERQSELASMRAIGFSRKRLIWLLGLENAWQLLGGIAIGGAAAILATIPAVFSGQPFAGILAPTLMIGVILLVGGVTSWLAAVLAMRWPLIASLRADT